MANSDEPEVQGVEVPIEWHVPDGLIPRYATNLVVQHQKDEFIINFFELMPPILVGDDAEKVDQLSKLENLRANCVARIIVPPGSMRKFVGVLRDNLAKYEQRLKRVDEDQ